MVLQEVVTSQAWIDSCPWIIRKDKRELLVVGLKKGRAADAVVGQILRYMGYVSQELAENGQAVK